MDSRTVPPRPPVPRVLLVSWPDGTFEFRIEGEADVYLSRVPMSFSREAEGQAEDLAEAYTPRRFRRLWDANCLAARFSTRPLPPTVLTEARETALAIRELNAPTQEARAAG